MYFTQLPRLRPARNDSLKTRRQPGAAVAPVSLIDVDETDVLRHVERAIAAAGERALHERDPDGQRGLRRR